MTKHTKQLQFTAKTKKQIYQRDGDQCIFCRMHFHMEGTSSLEYALKDCMHYINKSQGGLGIEQNGVTGCRYHHGLLDNGSKGLRQQMLEIMKTHLMYCYPGWNEEELYYNKRR